MDDGTEAAWREALKAKGKHWVQAQLNERPGRSDDPVFDLVFEAPFPTRAFCAQWCAEEDNKLFRISGAGVVTILVFVVFMICVVKAIGNWDSGFYHGTTQYGGGASSTGSPTAANTTGNVSDPSISHGIVGSSGRSSRSSTSTPSVCSYAAYATAECSSQP